MTCDTERANEVFNDIGQWSQATFGPDSERGPIGPLKHLGMAQALGKLPKS